MKELDLTDWKTKLYISFVIVGFLTIIIGLSLYFYKYHFQLNKNNEITKGVVIERQARRKSDVYIVCKYSIGLQSYKQSEQVNLFEYYNNCFFQEGDSVFVKYYPPNPKISKIDLDSSFNKWKVLIKNK